MKKIILLIMFLFIFTGCGSKNEVNILNWSSYIPDEVIHNFEDETGIKVNYNTYSSNEELLAKVSNSKSGTYDLIFPSDYMIEVMREKDMLDYIDKDKLSNYNNLNEKYLNQYYDNYNEYSIPFVATSLVISVNRDYIKDEITSYNDLINPKYKNDIVIIDDQRSVIGVALLANGYNINSVNREELDTARNWLKTLANNVKAFDSDSPKNFLISKETNLALMWNAEAALAHINNNSIQNIYAKEGTILNIDNFAILKGSKNKENAYTFINYILKPDVMKSIIESYPYKCVNKETDKILDYVYTTSIASNIPNYIFDNGHFIKNIGHNLKHYDDIWVDIK